MTRVVIDARRKSDTDYRIWVLAVVGPYPGDLYDSCWLAYAKDRWACERSKGYRGEATVMAATLARAKGAAIRHFKALA